MLCIAECFIEFCSFNTAFFSSPSFSLPNLELYKSSTNLYSSFLRISFVFSIYSFIYVYLTWYSLSRSLTILSFYLFSLSHPSFSCLRLLTSSFTFLITFSHLSSSLSKTATFDYKLIIESFIWLFLFMQSL